MTPPSAGRVGPQAGGQQFARDVVDVGGRVVVRDADQDEEAAPDGGDDGRVDLCVVVVVGW